MAIKELWVDQYRPRTVEGYVFRDEMQKKQVQSWIDDRTIPHLMFSGSAGVGKTTLARILINQLGVDEYDVKEINASRDNGVDYIRDTIEGFVQTMPFGDFKVVLLDECLHEDTLVSVLRNSSEELIPIKDVDPVLDLVKSFNVETNQIEWKPFELFDKGVQETIEIEFENGEVVICTPDHKWYVEDDTGNSIVVKASELSDYNHILTS
jgi:ATP-dependent protease HslVU (ClpYQ) ATPase subunit